MLFTGPCALLMNNKSSLFVDIFEISHRPPHFLSDFFFIYFTKIDAELMTNDEMEFW